MSETGKKKAAGAVESAKAERTVVYVGPGMRGLSKGSIFVGEIPEHVKEEIRNIPAMQELFIDTEKLPGAMQELRDSGSRLGTVYQHVAKKKRGA